ncbi:YwiC-like family protein [Micromonospora peucetia]|uniref:YwiC-like family protein n=2 Tax=Micromonospora peucetia TaxID=47871 RepID=A0ABZ1ED98_9ACTN|nr:YwiC-like family protein [Micromonospora peucetia]WSA31723.1 YwiC-like family protein [Micromonospora peucetia]
MTTVPANRRRPYAGPAGRPTAGGPGHPPGRPRSSGWVPPQHGAWAMLLLPVLAALTVTGAHPLHLLLLGAALAGYPLSYFGLQAVKTGRLRRVRPQLVGYGLATVALATPVLVARPATLAYAPLYAALAAVNVGYARWRRDRSFVNDLAFVAQCGLLGLVVATVAEVPWTSVAGVTVVVLGYLVGTILHVKTMIRERDSVRYRWVSWTYHAVAAVAAVLWASVPVAVLFTVLLARAALLAGRRVTPKRVGLVETACALLVLAAVVL